MTMSQSKIHRSLIRLAASALEKRFPSIVITMDLQRYPGDELPPLIGGFRPDMYGQVAQTNMIVIGEAKTDYDIDQRHSHLQIKEFISHLARGQRQNMFVLSVTGAGANRAKTLLRFMCSELEVTSVIIEVFDSYDFWRFDQKGGMKWNLI